MVAMRHDADLCADDDAILPLRMDALLNASPASFLSIIAGLIALYVYWTPQASAGLSIWIVFIIGIATVNVLAAGWRKQRGADRWSVRQWAAFASFMHLLSGLTWGVGGGWMLSMANEHQALVTLGIGLSAVTMSIPSVVFLPAYNLFQLPIFWSYSVGLMFSSLEFKWLIASGFFLLGVFAILVGRSLGSQLTAALRLSIENRRLAERLEERSAALQAANRELEIQSQTDPLTGVANRRRLMSFARAIRGGYALLMIDIDHFKSYNDTYGHIEGDACLVAVAETLGMSVRRNLDLVARLGGEEFAVVLSGASREQAMATAEALRQSVERLHVTRPRHIRRVVTVSIGVAVRDEDQRKTLATMTEEADTAVYLAKTSGRNRVCQASDATKRRRA